ncbi:MAG TPA: DUF748 domain-containing protein [Magnetospirillum sp.]|nr:DUF748 domain-containing protein [Magnetospirillum sp.]
MHVTTKTTTKQFWTRRRRIWAGGSAVAVVLLGVAGQWLPDWGLRYGLMRSLRDLGWPLVSVSAADMSLFNGAIVVRQVQAGEDLGKMLGIDGLDMTFRWKPLFSRRISLERLDLAGVNVDVRRQGANFEINGLPLAVTGGSSDGTSWTYDITSLTLTGSRIRFTDGATAANVEVERLEVQDLKSWEPALPVRYHLIGRLNGARIDLQGSATPFAASPGYDLRLNLSGLDLAAVAEAARAAGAGQPAGRLTADVSVHGAMGAPATVSGRVALDGGSWANGTTKVAAAQLALALDSLRWDAGKLSMAGTATAADLKVEDGGVGVSVAAAQLAARSAAWDGKTARLSWEGTLHADRHVVAANDIRIEHGSLDWRGTSRFDFSAQAQSFVHAEGRAETGDVRIGVGEMEITAQRLTTEGVFEHARPDGMLPPLAGRMDAAAEQVSVRLPGEDLVHADKLEARDLRLAPGSAATLARLEARAVAALARTGKGAFPWRFEARQAVVERAAVTADGAATLAGLQLNGAVGRVTRTKTGFLGLPDGDGAKKDGALPRVALGRLRLGGDSRVEFEDRSLAEPVRLRIEGLDVTLSDLDTARPDRDSPFTAKARIGTARLSAQGRGRPFADTPGGDVKAEIHALDLPPLSPYAANSLGVHLQTGQLDADVSLSAIQGKLDGGLTLTLSELFIAQPDPNAPIAKSADMPVETVLDLLRDSENRIHLTIPVRGDLANPDFDISDAVGQAVGGALKATVFTTLKVAFPLAGLISLVIEEGENQRLGLEPLAFAPGTDVLGTSERERLGSVAGLMTERPALRLTLCGVATEGGDGPVLAERKRQEDLGLLAKLQKMVGAAPKPETLPVDHDQLLQLADGRAQAAKAFLVDEARIDPGRLFTCRPRVEVEAKAAPRVDLVL